MDIRSRVVQSSYEKKCKSMKILFIEPPVSEDWTPDSKVRVGGRRHTAKTVTGDVSYNYWNLSAASILRNEGHNVDYIHCQTQGITYDELKRKIDQINPEMVVQCIEHIEIPVQEKITKYCNNKEIINIWAGPFITGVGNMGFGLKDKPDIIALKEYDYTISDIANTLEDGKKLSNVEGILFKDGKKTVQTKKREEIDLNKLPIPAYDLIDLKKFVESVFIRLPAATMITSRGCPYNCIFCLFPNTIYSHKWRAMNPERVLEEMNYLVEQGIREIRIDDDTYEVDRQRAIDISKLIIKEKLDLTYQPQCRPDLMTDELCSWMAKSGCIKILFGIESGSERILEKICKGMNTQQVYDGCMLARKHDIMLHNCFMIGFPWETMEDIEKTVSLAFEINAEFSQFAIATPLPGTHYYEYLKNEGFLVGDYSTRDSFSSPGVKYPHMSAEEIKDSMVLL